MSNSPAAGPSEPGLTIDELAQRVGMTVRNLREWRALGLLPPARMRGRTGYYDPAQVERIGHIRRLHADGFPLDLIRRILQTTGDSAVDAMRLAAAVRAPFRGGDPPLVDLEQLAAIWPEVDAADLRRAVELGLVRERPDGRLEWATARMPAVGEAMRDLGLSAKEALEATAEIRASLDRVAELFEQIWLRHVWEPFVAAGLPPDRLPAIQATLARMQPLALDSVMAVLTIAVDARIEQGIACEVERAASAAEPPPAPG